MDTVNVKTYVLVLTGLIVSFSMQAQIPWDYEQTSRQHVIEFDKNTVPEISGTPIDSNDVIGVFYDSGGKHICAGYSIWLNPPMKREVIAYGKVGNSKGFESGDSIYFKIWDHEKDCIVENFKLSYQVNSTYPDTAYFKEDGKTKVTSMQGQMGEVIFPKYEFCQNDDDPLPTLKNLPGSITFNSPSGLYMDADSGKIDVSASTPGRYEVKYNTEICLAKKQDSFRIKTTPTVDLGEDRAFCKGDTVYLKPGDNVQKFEWSVEGGDEIIPVTEGGDYWIKAWSQDGCMVSDTVNIKEKPLPELSLKDTIAGCNSIELSVEESPSDSFVAWSNGVSGNTTEVRQPGKYWVQKIGGNGCRAFDTTFAKVSTPMHLSRLEPTVKAAECEKNGKVEFPGANHRIKGGVAPYTYRLVPTGTGSEKQSEEAVFEGLEEGDYRLEVEDANGCRASLARLIGIPAKDCKNPVITLNGDGRGDSYYIPYQGKAKIYNRNGQLEKEMRIPAEWHGKDNNGNKVQMGVYHIVCNEDKRILITVVR